jgi:hypothetical protein
LVGVQWNGTADTKVQFNRNSEQDEHLFRISMFNSRLRDYGVVLILRLERLNSGDRHRAGRQYSSRAFLQVLTCYVAYALEQLATVGG